MYILLTGINHETAPVEIRERFAFAPSQMEQAYRQLNADPALEGLVILNTCNRTEIYATARDIEKGQAQLRSFLASISNLSTFTSPTAMTLLSIYSGFHRD